MNIRNTPVRLVCIAGVLGALLACSDAVAPVHAPTPEPPGEDVAAARPQHGEVLGGEAALEELRAMIADMTAQGRRSEIPANALAAIEVREGSLVPDRAPSFLLNPEEPSGPYHIDGVEYYEEFGVYYPPQGWLAEVRRPYTTGTLSPGSASISAGHDVIGHGGEQRLSWRLTKTSTGARINSGEHYPFGGFKKTHMIRGYVTGFVRINDVPACDVTLSANTTHYAWYEGGWFSQFTLGKGLSISIRKERVRGGDGASMLRPELELLPCPPPRDDGGQCENNDEPAYVTVSGGRALPIEGIGSARLNCDGEAVPGGSYSDEQTCWVCQQWFWVIMGVIVDEWWECDTAPDWECAAY